jgi:hypothetical protein
MRIRRTFPLVLAVVIVAAAVFLAVQLRKHAPPEPARLLPGADAFFYVNLSWARKVNSGNPLPPVIHEPEYEHFIEQTGFDFERDLDSVAVAAHYAANRPGGGNGAFEPEPRFSEVITGRFDGSKVAAYLKQQASSVENYHSVDIYSIPISNSNRTLRVAILSVDSIAGSNHDDPAVIRGIVDRSRRLASPFGGPAMLRRYYKQVQFASPVWLMARVDPLNPEFGGWHDFLAKPADVVISLAYNPLHLPGRLGAFHLRAEALATTDEDARSLADKVNRFLEISRSAETSVGTQGTDADVKAVFDSLQIHQEDEHAVLTATIPLAFLQKLLHGP